MASVGDYVQVRNTRLRGEVVQEYPDDWVRLHIRSSSEFSDTWLEMRRDQLVVLVKGEDG